MLEHGKQVVEELLVPVTMHNPLWIISNKKDFSIARLDHQVKFTRKTWSTTIKIFAHHVQNQLLCQPTHLSLFRFFRDYKNINNLSQQ